MNDRFVRTRSGRLNNPTSSVFEQPLDRLASALHLEPVRYSARKDLMKILILLLLSSLMVESTLAAQRLAEIQPGAPCEKILAIEKRLGSHELVEVDGNGIRKYSGVVGGQKATIVYQCDKGRLIEQKIIVTSASRELAYGFANDQKTKISGYFGDPIHDGLDLSIWKRLYLGFIGSDLDYLTSVVVWGKAKEDAMLLIRELKPNLWEVSLSQGGPKWEYILNH